MSTAQTLSAFAADAPRYGSDPVNAYYQLNQTGQAQNVQSVNGLGGQVVIELNGTPIPATGQNINIVAGTGVLSVAAGGQSANGNVGLTSTDGSIVFTNPGGANANINLQSVIPAARALVSLPSASVQIVGPSPFVPPTTALWSLSGLTVGGVYILSVFIKYIIDPGVNIPSTGAASQIIVLGSATVNNSANAPFLAGTSGPLYDVAYPLYADINDVGALSTGTSNILLPVTVSATITATQTSIGIYIIAPGTTTTGQVKANGFIQAVRIA
jgi:hypothetical protein